MIPMRRRAVVWLMASGALLTPSHLRAAQDKPASAAPVSSDQQDAAALQQAVTAATSRPSADSLITWKGNHFIQSQDNHVYIPFTFIVDRKQVPATTTAIYIRAVSRAAAATAATAVTAAAKIAWESTSWVDIPANGQISRAIALPPGAYDLYVAVKDKGASPQTARIGVLRHELTVPVLPSTELSTSSVILATSLEQMATPLPPDKQQDNPYVFGPLKVQPSIDGVFAQAGDLQVLFWIYGASQTAGKPDVQVDFSFFQRLPATDAEKEKYFNRTNPQELNARTLPAEFNLGSGHQLLSSLSVPLTTFPPGLYRLEIKVTDRPSGKSLTSNVTFEVSAV